MRIAIVGGVIANKLGNGGAAWTRLSWVKGLALNGFHPVFVEELAQANCVDAAGKRCALGESSNADWFLRITQAHGVDGTLIRGDESVGRTIEELKDLFSRAELLLNISGHLSDESLLKRVARRVYVDLDPGYTQYWHARETLPALERHTDFVTVGCNIGRDNCPIPTGGKAWIPTLQPVGLEDWPVAPAPGICRFTTIASWRGPLGAMEIDGVRLGPKAHEFRRFAGLPRQVQGADFEIALEIDAADANDRQLLVDGGWDVVQPANAVPTPQAFAEFIRGSSAEFSVAQGMYVRTNSGWFSDRTTRYLASGRPAIVQETGFGAHLPTGLGLFAFSTPREAVDCVGKVMEDYETHARAARRMAEEYFDAERVVSKLIERLM